MNKQQLEQYRKRLLQDGARVQRTADSVEEHARMATGGQAFGNLSNAPMHLGDMGTEVYLQELNSTLLENEIYLCDEIRDALERIDKGTFGRCEHCQADIVPERLEILPHARYCTPCAEKMDEGRPVNFNHGRLQPGPGTLNPHDDGPEERRVPPGKGRAAKRDAEPETGDVHAAGTPGGGTAVGGLAGTNIGAGDPINADLETAMGSGNYDVGEEPNQEEDEAFPAPSRAKGEEPPAVKQNGGGKKRAGQKPKTGTGG